MARQRNPNRDKAYKLWLEDKERPLVDIAKELGERPSTVRKWKSQDNWERSDSKGSAPIEKQRSVRGNDPPQLVIDNEDMTEQQKLFCLYYLECFNATKAYQKAYQCDYTTANSHGYRMLSNVVIKEELYRLKAELQQDVFLNAKDLIQVYMKQAFSDITDFTEFGQEIVQFSDGSEGPVSFVRLKDSDSVDGSLIQEVKKGKDGVSVKLYDKQKAMSELMKYLAGDDGPGEIENDGFIEALESEGEALWPEDE